MWIKTAAALTYRMKTFVPDTSVVVDGRITQMAKKGELAGCHIAVHAAVLSELEHQANAGRETGFGGLEELKALAELAKQGVIAFEYAGERPSAAEIRDARYGGIDAMIRALAKHLKATLVTADKVQAEVAAAEGIAVTLLEPVLVEKELPFINLFTPQTLSVHLKEDTVPLAKIGAPGAFELKRIGAEKSTREELEAMAKDVVEIAKRSGGFIEIDRHGATVVQTGIYRTAIARPPFSDGIEITIVRPIVKLSLDDYAAPEKLKARLAERAEGIIVSGPPGAGKSSFAAALAEYYMSQKKIVKTMESPRDLQVADEITQYAPLEGSFEKTADILLLVRPDYTVYDEMRKTEDFRIFADMRLAGIGMIGVVHANRPIDAVQRFMGRIELGLIPQVVDTIIFIKGGSIRNVHALYFKVKVPTGMIEADLARPVIEVRDFESDALEYEIYKFGEESVILPVKQRPAQRKAEAQRIERMVARYARHPFSVETGEGRAVIYADPRDIPGILGRKGTRIEEMQRKAGVHIDVRER
jgi:ATPase